MTIKTRQIKNTWEKTGTHNNKTENTRKDKNGQTKQKQTKDTTIK